MPTVSITLPDTEQSISRPVVIDIVNQIKSITKIPSETKMFFPGDMQKMKTSGSDIDSDQKRLARFDTDRYLFIDVNEWYDEDYYGTTATHQCEQIPIFVDRPLGIYLYPIYAKSSMEINFRYRSPSKTEVLRWRDDIRVRVSRVRPTNLHDVHYHYNVPGEYLNLLKEVHNKREGIEGYGETFNDYLEKHFSRNLTVVGNLVGKDATVSIAETQVRIIGYYDFETIPEKPERDDNGTWQVSFVYRTQYDKPIALVAKYPISVHNQLLPPEYTIFYDKDESYLRTNKYRSYSLSALSRFESDNYTLHNSNPYYVLRLPNCDDFIVENDYTSMGTVFTALCLLDDDKQTLVNLNDLGDIMLDTNVLQFIKEVEWQYICKPFTSILNISLFRNNFLTNWETVACDKDLNISSPKKLNLRNQYRLRLGIVTDFTLLDKKCLDRLREYPAALVTIIGAINELLKLNPKFVELAGHSVITERELSAIYQIITGIYMDNGMDRSYTSQGPFQSWPNYRMYPNSRAINMPRHDLDMFGFTEDELRRYRHTRIMNGARLVTQGVVALRNDPT